MIRRDQTHISAIGVELEAGVQLLPSNRAIFSRGKHQQISAGAHHRRGHSPFVRDGRIVCEKISVEVQVLIARVVNLNPIRGIVIRIKKRVMVGGHELIDDRRDRHHQALLQAFDFGAQCLLGHGGDSTTTPLILP